MGALAFGASGVIGSPALAVDEHALPSGGSVAGGSAAFDYTQAGQLHIHQNSQRAIINWNSFNIGKGALTEFHQPGRTSIAVNRVTGGTDPTQILGSLKANGTVMVLDPNGVFFGADSRIDVGGIVASTGNIDDAAFMAGERVHLTGADTGGMIVNHGMISVSEAGLAAFVAPNIVNSGIITARMGRVQLGAGESATLDLYGDGLMELAVAKDTLRQTIVNAGIIYAEGGVVQIEAAAAKEVVDNLILNTGIIAADAFGADREGRIVLYAHGSNKTDRQGSSAVINAGLIDASGREEGERGGSVEILGDHIALLDGSIVDASGYQKIPLPVIKPFIGGTATMTEDKRVRSEEDFLAHQDRVGGSIKIGGDYLGTGDTPTAKKVYVAGGALIINDAIHDGDAGRTIVWSDDTTEFHGSVLARGGVEGGNGGFLETSGKKYLAADGFADLSARGDGFAKGTYLLDPADIMIYGNVDPTFVSTDSSVDLGGDLVMWLDAADPAAIELTYADLGATASGTIGTNTITTSADVSSSLVVGARIRLTGAGAVATADTVGGHTYTITNISGTTITVAETLTQTYTGDTAHRGLVSQWFDASGQANNAVSAASEFPLYDSLNDRIVFSGAQRMNVSTVTTGTLFIAGKRANDTNNIWAQVTGGQVGSERGISFLGPHGQVYYLNESAFVNSQQRLHSNYTGTLNTELIMSAYDDDMPNSSFAIGYGTPGFTRLNGFIDEFIIYDSQLSLAERTIVEQFQSVKWGLALDPLTGAGTEAAEAMASTAKGDASNGFSAFTTRYLEKLSTTADIVLAADNTITFDLQGDTLNLADNRSITLTTTSGNISSLSAGTLQTNRTAAGGNITMTAGADINLSGLALNAQNGGAVTLQSGTGGTINIDSAVDAGNLTLKGDEIDIAGNLSGTGNVQLTSRTALQKIELGSSDAGSLNLTAAELAFLQDGWSSITIGDEATHTGSITVSEAVTFSDNVALKNASVNESYIDINAAITTVDDADLTLDGNGQPTGGNPHSYIGVHVGGDLNVARNLNITSGPDFGAATNMITVGNNMTVSASNAVELNTNLQVGGNLYIVKADHHAIRLHANRTADISGNVDLGSGTVQLDANSILRADGNITIKSSGITFDATASILGNADGSSNLTFTEYGENAAMELGGTSAGHTWQMTASEVGVIKEGFNKITFGSSLQTKQIQVTGAIGFSDDVYFLNTGDDGTIMVGGAITTTDGADLYMEGGSAANVGWDAIDIDADLNISGDATLKTGAGSGSGHIQVDNTNFIVGGNLLLSGENNNNINSTTLSVGGDLTAERPSPTQSPYNFDVGTATIGGNFDVEAGRLATFTGDFDIAGNASIGVIEDNNGNITINDNFIVGGNLSIYAIDSFDLGAGASIQVDGDMDISSARIAFNSTASISGNADGSSTLTFLEDGEDDAMEMGGTAAGHTWQMEDGELGVIQNGFDKVIFGSASQAGDIVIDTWDLSSADYNVEIYGTDLYVSGLTLGAGDFLADSRNEGILTVDGDINRNNAATTALNFYSDNRVNMTDMSILNAGGVLDLYIRAGRSIVTDGFTYDAGTGMGDVTFHSNHDQTVNGAVFMTNTSIATNGGDLVIGGGADPLNDPAMGDSAGVRRGVVGDNFHADTGHGSISIRGQGRNLPGNEHVGIDLSGSSLTSEDGDIFLQGGGGVSGVDQAIGIRLDDTDITSETGTISLAGIGGGTGIENYGIHMLGGSVISSTGTGATAGIITLDGTGGTGTDNGYGVYITGTGTKVSSVDGAIEIAGQGGGTGDENYGIYLSGQADIVSTGTGANAATIMLDGTGANSDAHNYGVYIHNNGTTVTSVDGDIDITGQGGNGTGGFNYGIYLENGAVTSTGTGLGAAKLSLTGTSGTGNRDGYGVATFIGTISSGYGDIDITGISNGSGARNYGIHLYNSTSVSSTGTGANAADITLTGTASNGTTDNIGVVMQLNANLNTVDGDIDVTGLGGDGTSSRNHGIYMVQNADIVSTGGGADAGTISLDGGGGDGTADNYGVYVTGSGTSISAADGNIDIEARGGDGSTDNNYGLYLADSAVIESTGAGINAADIHLNATGGDGAANNRGIYIDDSGTRVSSVDGDIDIEGYGGNGSGGSNEGVRLEGGAVVRSTGTASGGGAIELFGQGGIGTGNNTGVIFAGGNSRVTSAATGANAKSITITGIGGNGSGAANIGFQISNGGDGITSADGDIIINGTGNGAGGTGHGVNINHGYVTAGGTGANAGNITITGTGASSGNNNYGFVTERWNSAYQVRTTDGDLTISGTGGSGIGTNNHGIYLSEGNNAAATVIETVGAGNIVLNGISGPHASSYDLYMRNTANGSGLGNAAMTGDITINANTVVSDVGNFFTTGGDLYFIPRSASTSIGLGGAAGVLNLDDAELAQFSIDGDLHIGRAGGTGMVLIDSADLSAGGYGLEIIGGKITVNGGLNVGGSVFLKANANRDIVLKGPITAQGPGNSIILATGGNFINDAGAGGLNPGSGRFLVYANSSLTSNRGGLSGGEIYGESFESLGPNLVPGGSTFIYTYRPNVFDLSIDHEMGNYSTPGAKQNMEMPAKDLAEDGKEDGDAEQAPHIGGCLVTDGDTGGCLL